jgi:hypothetical protein
MIATDEVSEERLREIIHGPNYRVSLLEAELMAAEILRRRASESDGAGSAVDRWVAWKPGDALPADGVYAVTLSEARTTCCPEICVLPIDSEWFRDNVIAYWSRPLPAPYTPPTVVKTVGSESDE